jgi:hypothetical protein
MAMLAGEATKATSCRPGEQAHKASRWRRPSSSTRLPETAMAR